MPPTGDYCREDRCQSHFRFDLVPTRRAPLEECEAAGAIESAGGIACVIDAPAEGLDLAAIQLRLAHFRPDLVVLVTTHGSLQDDLLYAKPLRDALPGVRIAVRGAPAYTHAEAILAQAPGVDCCVRGDYELVFERIVREGIGGAGTVYRDGLGVRSGGPPPMAADLDALPRPARSVVDPGRYRVRGLGAPQATVRVQRGCPFPCSYCLVHTVSGDRARHRSPGSVADEVAALCEAGIRHFYLRAETFSLDRRFAIETSLEIARRAPAARWVTTTRAECVDDEVVGAMAQGGCYGISFGLDVGSEAIGRRVGKRPDAARAHEAMRLCDRHGVLSLGYLMIGFAWDTEETLAETAHFARRVRPDLLTVHFAHPYPGTRYHDEVRALGLHVRSPRAQAEPAFGTPALAVATLERFARRMLVRHYASPRVWRSLASKGLRRLRPGA
ncbi:MAG: radical SAM protein [Spirochaetaceae bacterium]|nr:radical SAM protein [Myxococcales bacterium]MCB9725187.1 radical SAM protein [Spirochaetaceae bacterium]